VSVWHLAATLLPDGHDRVDMWVERGRLALSPPGDGHDADRLPGAFVLPGLVDAHAHLSFPMSPTPLAPGSTDLIAANVEVNRRAGVLLMRDVGALPGVRVRGTGVIAAGRFLAPAGGYTPGVYRPVPSEQLAEAASAELAAGDGWVKIVADHPVENRLAGPTPLTYDPHVLAAAVTAVHAAGGRVAVHTTGPHAPAVAATGVDSVEHGLGLDGDALAAMAARGAAWTPTLTTALALLDYGADVEDERSRADAAEVVARLRELVPLAGRLGLTVLAGTDVTPHGSVAREVARLADFGLEPAAALAAASTSARAFLGRPSLDEGAPADLVTYDADPRDDPEVLLHPAAIVAAGRRVR
jgi:imidazolonepropionase-like amidohydrolase